MFTCPPSYSSVPTVHLITTVYTTVVIKYYTTVVIKEGGGGVKAALTD